MSKTLRKGRQPIKASRTKASKTPKGKTQKPTIVQGTIQKKAGWLIVSVFGNPFDRGFAHGYLLHKELKKMRHVLKYLVTTYYKTTLREYLDRCMTSINHHLQTPKWAFIEQELRGICAGYKQRTRYSKTSCDISYEILVGWNSYLSMSEIYEDEDKEKDPSTRCSAFIATGSSTHDGKVLMAHNTHTNFASGFISNIALYVYPEDPESAFMMQTAPGLICSSTDWFITKRGIIGCETTIAYINYVPDFTKNVPYFLRIRKAMEQGKSLDDYVAIMTEKNAGDYACSWLLGDIRTNEIMRFEQGHKIQDVKRTTDGVFYGMNSAFSPELRTLETTDIGLMDPDSGTGARNLRFEYLLGKSKLTIVDAKRIIADHYDVGENCERKGMRTICKHRECEEGKEFAPSGATDGKVVDSKMASLMEFEGIMGSSCGRIFKKQDYPDSIGKHGNWKQVIDNMPKWHWTNVVGPQVHYRPT